MVIMGTATFFTVIPTMILFGKYGPAKEQQGPCSGWHGCEGVFDDPSGCVTLWEVVEHECTDNNVSKLYTAEHPSSRKAAASNYRQGWQHAGGGVAPNTGNIHSAVEKCYKLPAGGGGRGGEGTIPSDDERNFGPSDNQEPTLMVMTTTVGGPQSLGDERWTLQRGAATTWASRASTGGIDTRCSGHRIFCGTSSIATTHHSLFVFAAEEARKVGARFAGYSNGDIAFDSSVLDVLKAVGFAIDGQRISNKVLLIGKRLNIFDAESDARELEALAKDPVDLRHRETNTWMSENSEDFFFFTPEVFEDWKDLPNFVLGRVGWDSWMAQWAMDNEVDVIDVTKFLHVSHLTGSDGNLAGWGRCKLGSVKQGAWIMNRASNGRLDVVRKPMVTRVERESLDANSRLTAIDMMRAYKLPDSSATMFLDAVREPIPRCETQGTCCSMQGTKSIFRNSRLDR
eukprot:gene7307-18691_t